MKDTTAEAATQPDAAAFERLRAGYAARYGAAVFDVTVISDGGRAVLTGTVLMARQRDDAMEVARTEFGASVEDGVVVLLEAESLPWYEARDGLDIVSGPDGELATQVVAGDPPIRRLVEREQWWVVELADGTVGWCRPTDELAPLTPDRAPLSIAEWRAAFRGSWTPPSTGWPEAVKPWQGTPYLWGGNTGRGVDCSGFVQRVVKQAAGLGLPKHSVDQIRAGRRIEAAGAVPGDLIYLTRRDDGVRHIALVVDSGPPIAVAHASRELGVTVESLDHLLARYELRGVSRLGPDPEGASRP